MSATVPESRFPVCLGSPLVVLCVFVAEGVRMASKKGSKCPTCESFTLRESNGVWECSSCASVCWTAFDRPSAGKPRKGYGCGNCGNNTVHPVCEVGGATIWRCSVCGWALVEKQKREPK